LVSRVDDDVVVVDAPDAHSVHPVLELPERALDALVPVDAVEMVYGPLVVEADDGAGEPPASELLVPEHSCGSLEHLLDHLDLQALSALEVLFLGAAQVGAGVDAEEVRVFLLGEADPTADMLCHPERPRPHTALGAVASPGARPALAPLVRSRLRSIAHAGHPPVALLDEQLDPHAALQLDEEVVAVELVAVPPAAVVAPAVDDGEDTARAGGLPPRGGAARRGAGAAGRSGGAGGRRAGVLGRRVPRPPRPGRRPRHGHE